MNLLVTGGAGFIGSAVVRHALRQAGVRRLVVLDCLTYAGHRRNLEEVAGDPRFVFEQVDLRDAAAVRQVVAGHAISHVQHLAAESHVDRSIAAPADFVTTNVTGTFHLLEACRAAWRSGDGTISADARFLMVSTDEVYGSLGPDGRFGEGSPYDPRSPYAASKAAADHLARACHHTYGLPVLVTNCSNNYGPRQHPEKLIPVVIQAALEGRPIPVYGDGRQVRDWLHVEDHAEALWQVLRRGRVGATYLVGAGNEWANLPLVERLCDLVDELRPGVPRRSRELIRHVTDRPGHDRRYAIDASRLRAELGWEPRHDFAASLRATVQWYLDHQDWVRAVQARA